MTAEPPPLSAHLTYVKVNGGRAHSSVVHWDAPSAPAVGAHVMVSDGSLGPFEAVIVEIRPDGDIRLVVPEFRPVGYGMSGKHTAEAIAELDKRLPRRDPGLTS